MKIDILEVGSKNYPTNCYIVYYDKNCLIIDPGYDENFIVSYIKEKNLNPIAILITHNHDDHNGCAKSLSNVYAIDIYDYNNLFEENSNILEFNFDVIYTPGHSTDSICFHFEKEKIMFVGDFIFYEDIGATHFKGGNEKQMIESIKKIKEYNKDIKLYPGHGKITSLEHELKHNKYFDV